MERFFMLDKFNTFYDWRLILTAKDVTPPEPKTNYVDLGGVNGTLDLSESLTGEIAYNDRTVTASFWTNEGTRTERETLLRDIRAALHGRKIKLIEPDDPDHYFYGRVKITSEKNIVPYAEFSIEAICEPWRYANEESERFVEVNDNAVDVVLSNNGVKTLSPTITVTGSVTIEYNGATVELTAGSYRVTDIKLYRGANIVTVSGTGTVVFTYKEADL